MSNCESKSNVRRENNRIRLGQKNEGLDRSIKIWKRFRACALGNLIHTWYYLVLFLYPACRKCLVLLYTGLDGYHLSGSFCDFLEAFKQTYIVKPKTTRDLKEFFWANFTLFRQKYLIESSVIIRGNIY